MSTRSKRVPSSDAAVTPDVAELKSVCHTAKRRIERISIALAGTLLAMFAAGYAHFSAMVGGYGSSALMIQEYQREGIEHDLAARTSELLAFRTKAESPPDSVLADYARLESKRLAYERALERVAAPEDDVPALGYTVPRALLFSGGWLVLLVLAHSRNGAVATLRRNWHQLHVVSKVGADDARAGLKALRMEFAEVAPHVRGVPRSARERWLRFVVRPVDLGILFLAYASVASTAWAIITAWRAGLPPNYALGLMIALTGALGLLLYRFAISRGAYTRMIRRLGRARSAAKAAIT